MFSDVIILAGGYGQRLWPASTKLFPKQFMSVKDDLSFLQNSILRAAKLGITGRIIIASRKGLEEQIALQCHSLCEKLKNEKERNGKEKKDTDECDILIDRIKRGVLIVAEPTARHTCAPIVLSHYLMKILEPNINHSFLVLTSDQIIEPFSAFKSDVEVAYKVTMGLPLVKDKSNNKDCSKENKKFVCFGVPPTFASGAYGYIQAGESLDKDKDARAFKIKMFKEKPDIETAKEYIKEGCYWNSGMFCFEGNFFIEELKHCTKEVYEAFFDIERYKKPKITKLLDTNYIENWEGMEEAYSKTLSIAIDKAVAEKTTSSAIVTASFTWDDIGSWDSFEKYCNIKTQNSIAIKSDNSFIYSDIPVAICGASDISVIIKNGKALIMKKGCSDLVREVAERMGGE